MIDEEIRKDAERFRYLAEHQELAYARELMFYSLAEVVDKAMEKDSEYQSKHSSFPPAEP